MFLSLQADIIVYGVKEARRVQGPVRGTRSSGPRRADMCVDVLGPVDRVEGTCALTKDSVNLGQVEENHDSVDIKACRQWKCDIEMVKGYKLQHEIIQLL